MKRILLILAGIFGLLLVAALAVPFFIPKSVYKEQVEKAATGALGREVVLSGDVGVSVFPRIAAGIGGVSVANPEGFSSQSLIQAGELRGSVKWMPLLSGRVEVEEITFVDADVQLEKLADGRVNWEFTSGPAETTPAASEGGSSAVSASIGKASLKNASLTYRDDAAGTVYELKNLNVEASMQGFDKPLKASADGQFQDLPFDLTLTLETPEAIQAGSPAALDLKLTSSLLNAAYDGTLSLEGDGAVNGRIDASSDDLRGLMKLVDVEMTPGETLQSFSAVGTLAGSFKTITLSDLTLMLDDIKGTGSLGVDLSGAKPKVTGDLDMGSLDLSPFLTASDAAETPAESSTTGWSTEPLDLASLNAVDADLKVSTSSLTIGNVTLNDASVESELKNGRLKANLPAFNAFGGSWAGKMTVDASGSKPAMSMTMTGDNIGISSLLSTLAGFDKLTGTGTFAVSTSATGGSINEIMHALNGEISTNLTDGAIKGLNVAQLVRSKDSLQTALLSGNLQSLDFSSALSDEAETDFTSFDTVLKITNGVADVDLMKLLSPVLGIDGSGNINLGGQTLDLLLETSVDKSAQGSGSTVQLNGIPVPIRLSGSWASPKMSPDLSAVTSSLQSDLQGQLLDQLGGSSDSSASNALTDLLGVSGSSDEDEDKEESTEDAAKEALSGLLFGKKKKTDD